MLYAADMVQLERSALWSADSQDSVVGTPFVRAVSATEVSLSNERISTPVLVSPRDLNPGFAARRPVCE